MAEASRISGRAGFRWAGLRRLKKMIAALRAHTLKIKKNPLGIDSTRR